MAKQTSVNAWPLSEDAVEPHLLGTFGRSPVHDLAWSHDGRFLASAGDDGFKVWTLEGKKLVRPHSIRGSGSSATGDPVAISSDGERIAVREEGVFSVYPVTGRRASPSLEMKGAPTSLAFAPDGDILAAITDHDIEFVHEANGTWRRQQLIASLLKEEGDAEFAGGFTWLGRHAFAFLCTTRKSDAPMRVRGGRLVEDPNGDLELEARFDEPLAVGLTRISSPPGSRRLALWDHAPNLKIAWPGEVSRARDVVLPAEARDVAWDHQGRFLHIAMDAGLMGLDPDESSTVYELPDVTIDAVGHGLAVNPRNGLLATASREGVRLWDMEGSQRSEPNYDLNVVDAVLSDRPSHVDHLGYTPYVRGITRFLAAEATQPPLTISIEGPWGSGKSSFMLQMRYELERQGHLCVEFNAWHHGTAEGLYAAFALDIIRALQEAMEREASEGAGLSKREQILQNIQQAVARSNESAEDAVRRFATEIGIDVGRGLLKGIPFVGDALDRIAGRILERLEERRQELSQEAVQVATSIDYETRLEFFSRFKQDMTAFLDAYAGDRRIYVFIDDLDRCDLAMAARLMHALNLLMDALERLYFVLGLDRAKVAASIALHHEELLPFLLATPERRDPPDILDKRRFGYEFLEKFIQLPFSLPHPSPRDIERYIEALTGADEATAMQQQAGTAQGEVVTRSTKGNGETKDSGKPPSMHAWTDKPIESPDAPGAAPVEAEVQELATEVEARESRHVHEAAALVAGFLENNPRRIQHFVNLYRLRVLIGAETGLFAPGDGPGAPPTPMSLAKFVALTVRYPHFVDAIAHHPELLEDLHTVALGGQVASDDAYAQHWAQKPSVLDLFKAGCIDERGDATQEKLAEYGLRATSVKMLTGIAPASGRREPLAKNA